MDTLTPWSILYIADEQLFKVGPFQSEDEAMKWAKEHDSNNVEDIVDSEFDIQDQHVYLMSPYHQLTELTTSDLGVE